MKIERLTTILREIAQWEIAEDEEAATSEPAADDDVDADVDSQKRQSEAARSRLPSRRDS